VPYAHEEYRAPPVPDGDELDRPSFRRRPDRLEASHGGKGRHQRPQIGPELRERQELADIGHAREERGEIDVASGYDSSFDE